MRRTGCAACGYDDLEPILDLGTSPIADAYTLTRRELSERYPLQLAVCTGCWLVQLLEVVDPVILFGSGYSFYSSASAPLSAYQQAYAAQVLTSHGALAKRLTVEIGCNDGDLLRHFGDAGCEVLGVDPARGPVNKAKGRGLHVWSVAFDELIGEEICDEIGAAGVVVANHVLAHVESVADVLAGIRKVLAPDGVAYIEVQYLPDLLVNNAFDLVYHEHRNFFSLTNLESALNRWGLHVIDAELTDRQGGSLRVQAVREAPTSGPTFRTRQIKGSETWLRDVAAYRGFQGRAERIRTRLLDIITDTADGPNDVVMGYGAPAKATTLLNFCDLTFPTITEVTDTTTAKQGRYIPGTGIRIIEPGRLPDPDVIALVLAWNYAPQILRHELAHTSAGGRWIIPFPAPVLL
jgi:SAM-dependent methyltransferase